jgi:hypothetical protein
MTSPTTSADAVKVLIAELRKCRTYYDGTIMSDRAGADGVCCGLIRKAEEALTTLTQHAEAGAVATVIDEVEVKFGPNLSRKIGKTTKTVHLHRLDIPAGTKLFLHPAQAASQEGEKGVTVELVIPTPGAIKTFAHPAADKVRVTDAMVERMFAKARGYDCFFMFDNETLRRCVAQWLAAALSPPANGENDGQAAR